MSEIKRTGVFDGGDFPELKSTGQARGFVFSGATLPTTLALGVLDDAGTFVPFTDATVTVLPTDFIVNAQPPAQGLILSVVGGSPDFLMTAFNAGPIVG